jgi:putative hydrolase of the HAD superfamily
MEALIFDFDGLIVDTELPAFNAWQEIYRQHGQELPLEIWSKVIGTDEESSFDPHKYLEELTTVKVTVKTSNLSLCSLV